jgi:hypothetical protein
MGQRGGDLAAPGVVLADEQHLRNRLLHLRLRLRYSPQPLEGEALDDDRQEVRSDGGTLAEQFDRVLEMARHRLTREDAAEIGRELLDRRVQAPAQQGTDLDVRE